MPVMASAAASALVAGSNARVRTVQRYHLAQRVIVLIFRSCREQRWQPIFVSGCRGFHPGSDSQGSGSQTCAIGQPASNDCCRSGHEQIAGLVREKRLFCQTRPAQRRRPAVKDWHSSSTSSRRLSRMRREFAGSLVEAGLRTMLGRDGG